MQLADRADTLYDIFFFFGVGLRKHALVPHALAARLVGVNARHDHEFFFYLFVQRAQPFYVFEDGRFFMRRARTDDDEQFIRFARDDVLAQLVAFAFDFLQGRGQRLRRKDFFRRGDFILSLKHSNLFS